MTITGDSPAGVDIILGKPVTPAELRQAVAALRAGYAANLEDRKSNKPEHAISRVANQTVTQGQVFVIRLVLEVSRLLGLNIYDSASNCNSGAGPNYSETSLKCYNSLCR